MLSTSERIGWCWFRAIYSLFRALVSTTVCRLSCYIHVPTVAKSSLPILVSANEPHGTSTSLIHTVQQCSAVEFYHFLHCSENSPASCSAVQLRLLGAGGLYFHQEERTEAGWLRRGGGRITFSSARGKKEADCFAWNNLQFAPQTIFSLKKKKQQIADFFLYECDR